MKVKHFHIRLNKESLLKDEEAINTFMQSVSVKKTATQLISKEQANLRSILVFYDDAPAIVFNHDGIVEKQNPPESTNLNEEETYRYDTLRSWRSDRAAKENVPNYVIAHNSQLASIAKLNPSSAEDLFQIKGFGQIKVAKYGDEIIALLNSI